MTVLINKVLLRCLFSCLICVGGGQGIEAALAKTDSFSVDSASSSYSEHLDGKLLSRRAQLQLHVNKFVRMGRVSDARGLVSLLIEPARSDQEKAWLIYRWVTGRVSYDLASAAKLGDPRKHSLEDLMTVAHGACHLYAHLTNEMFLLAGLSTKLVTGFVKSSGRISGRSGRVSHAWNVVRIDGQWKTVDATWGAGYLSNTGFTRQQSDLFFFMPSTWVALNYFDSKDTVGAQRRMGVKESLFDRLPDGSFYMSVLGFPVREILSYAVKGDVFVETYALPDGGFKVLQAPLVRYVKSGSAQYFHLESSRYEEVVAVQGDNWTFLQKANGRFSTSLKPRVGELLLMGRRKGQDEFEALLGYSAR